MKINTRQKDECIMKRTIVMMCAMFGLICAATAENAVPASGWTNDWSAFVKELSSEVARDNYFVGNVNRAFSGKKVEWTGTVTEIKRPSKATESALIRLSMKTENLLMKSGSPVLDSLVVTPDADEWKTWDGVAAGSMVMFATTLDEGELLPRCVLCKMDGMGVNEGKVVAWINTRGGVCQKVLGQNKKLAPDFRDAESFEFLGESLRPIQQTIEFIEPTDTPQAAIREMVDAAKADGGSVTDGLIRQYVPRTDIMTTADMAALMRMQLPQDSLKRFMGAMVDDLSRTRDATDRFFPMRKGLVWEYEVRIRGDYWISDGCIQAVRKAIGTERPPNMRVSIMSVSTEEGGRNACVVVENNIMRYAPAIGGDRQMVYHTTRCKACQPLANGLAVTDRHSWRANEKCRIGADGKTTASKDIHVSARIERLWWDETSGQAKRALCWHEVFFAPLMDSIVRKDGFTGIRTRFRLGEPTVTTPSGSYTGCVERVEEIVLGDGKWTTLSTFAPGVGLVRSVQRNPSGDVTMEMDLAVYSTPKKETEKP